MIRIENLTKRFRGKTVIDGFSCELDKGIYGLLGPNGAGKTTFMRCLTNLYPLNGGKILIDGVSREKTKARVGYLPQFFGLYKDLKVIDSMKYFCSLKKVDKKEQERMIDDCLAAVNMSESKKTKGKKLSGGMMRRVGIAQALLNHPELILFDEPTAGLDPEERMHFKNVLVNLGKEETVIISTHIVEDIEAVCDHVIVMNGGKLCGVFTCEELRLKADEMVFECPAEKKELISGRCLMEKQYERDGKVWYRVLSGEGIEGLEPVEPVIEDGYMCVIKGMALKRSERGGM